MKKSALIILLIIFGLTLYGQTDLTVTISYVMNKTNPPSYTFSANFSGTGAQYYWYFGDESSSQENSPTYTFRYSKKYVINLKILDKDNMVHYGRLEAVFTGISSDTTCKAYFTFTNSITDNNSIVARKVIFTNQSNGEIKECKWTFGDGASSNERNVTHEFAAFGEYKVCLNIATTDGCQSEYCTTVKLSDPALPVIIPGKGFVKDLSAIAGCGLAIVLENGTTLLPVVMVPNFVLKAGQYVELGYEILLNVATNCQAGKPVKIHKIAEVPSTSVCKAYFTATNDIWSNPAMMKKVVFSNQSTGEIKECKWDFGDGATGSDRNPVHEYPAYGIYKACLHILTQSGCSSDYCGEVVVDSLSASTCNFDLVIKQKDLSANLFVFYAISKTEIKTWKWSFGDGYTSDAQNPDHLYEKPGTYEVTCTIVTSTGCTTTRVAKLTVAGSGLPVCPGAISLILFDPDGSLTACNGKAIVALLDENGKKYEGVKYFWSNGMTGDTARNLCPDRQYIVHAVVSYVCQKNTSFAFLTAPVWKVESSDGKYTFSVISPSDSIIYRWDFGDGKYAFGNAVEYSYKKEGNYEVTLTAISGNYMNESSRKLAVIANTTPASNISSSDLKVYPIPAHDFIRIETGKSVTGGINAEIINMKGQKISDQHITVNGQQFIEINIRFLPAGMYLLRMNDNHHFSIRMKFQKFE